MDKFITEFFHYVYQEDMKGERFLSLPKEEQDKLMENGMNKIKQDVESLTAKIQNRNIKLALNHTFHPGNKYYRKLFKIITGVELPKGSKDTYEVVCNYVGKDRINTYNQEQAAILKAEKEKKNNEIINNLKEKVKENKTISGEELVVLARFLNVEIHPRTAGMLKKRVKELNSDAAIVQGKSIGDNPFSLYKQLRGML